MLAAWSLSIRLPTKSRSSELVTMHAQSAVTKSQEKIYKMQFINLTETLIFMGLNARRFPAWKFFVIHNIIEISLEITIGNS